MELLFINFQRKSDERKEVISLFKGLKKIKIKDTCKEGYPNRFLVIVSNGQHMMFRNPLNCKNDIQRLVKILKQEQDGLI